jgi:GDP-L-fucose synthase
MPTINKMAGAIGKGAKIYVAGHRGMVGSAITRRLLDGGYTNIVTRTHNELDLLEVWR